MINLDRCYFMSSAEVSYTLLLSVHSLVITGVWVEQLRPTSCLSLNNSRSATQVMCRLTLTTDVFQEGIQKQVTDTWLFSRSDTVKLDLSHMSVQLSRYARGDSKGSGVRQKKKKTFSVCWNNDLHLLLTVPRGVLWVATHSGVCIYSHSHSHTQGDLIEGGEADKMVLRELEKKDDIS